MSKNILKIVLLSVMLLMTNSIVAQRGQGNRGNKMQSQNQMHGERELPRFNAKNAVGILKYDHERVLKKTKVKKTPKKNRVAKIISDYNHTIAEISFLHSEELKATERFVALKRAAAKGRRDLETMQSIQSEAMEKLIPIKYKVRKAEQVLNEKLRQVFSEKQYHKWRRMQRARKENLKPKRPDHSQGERSQKGGRGGR